MTPKGLDTPITTTATALQMVPIAAQNSNQLYLSNIIVIFGLASLAVSFVAIATLVRKRGAVLATLAATLGAFSSFCAALGNLLVGFNLATAASAHMAPEDAARFLTASFNSVIGGGFVFFEAIGLAVAIVLMAIALWRSRCVPRWLPILLVISLEIALLAPTGIVAIPLMLPFALAMVLLASQIWRSPALPASPS